MSEDRRDLEDRLRRSLERRADRVERGRLDLATIRSEAGRRRRARAARVVGGSVAAVAAVAVLVALLPRVLTDGPDGPDLPPTAPTGTPTSSASATPSPTAPPTPRLALADLDRGADPGIGVLLGDELTEPGGETRVIPPAARQMGVTDVTRAGDALLVADGRIFEGTRGLSLVEDGAATDLGPCTTGDAAAAPDGRAAWVTFGCPESGEPAPTLLVRRAADGSTTSTALPYPPDDNVITSAVGLVGDQVLLTRGFVDGASQVDPDGTLTAVPGVTGLEAVGPDGTAAIATPRGGGPTTVVDLPSGRARWRGPDLLAFSPNGSRVVAGYDQLRVHAAGTGRLLATLAPPDGVRLVGEPVWEDEDHLLAIATDDAGRSVVRLGLDGSVERAGPPLPDRVQVLLVP